MSETTEIKGQFGLGQSGGTGKKLNMFILQMSNFFVEKPTNPKRDNLDMINAYVHIHDLKCNCNTPLQHIINQLIEKEPELTKCLTTPTTEDGRGDAVDTIEDGDLDRLFEEDFGEDDADTR